MKLKLQLSVEKSKDEGSYQEWDEVLDVQVLNLETAIALLETLKLEYGTQGGS